MSDTLIPVKVTRLAKHLQEGGKEADAPRVLKIRDEDLVKRYLEAAKEGTSSPTPEAGGPKEASAKKPPSAPTPEAGVKEEDLTDEFDEDDNWDAEEADEDTDQPPAAPEEDREIVSEEASDEIAEVTPTETPTPKATEPGATSENVLIDDNGLQQPLTLVSTKKGKTIWKVRKDELVSVMIGRQSVNVSREAVLNATDPMFPLEDGSLYPTEFVKAAVQLAIL